MSVPSPVPSPDPEVTDPVLAPGDGTGRSEGPAPRRRSPLLAIPLVGIALVLIITAIAVLAQPPARPSGAPLGAASQMAGGMARINGLIPLETDGWLPPEGSAALEGPVPNGRHRVRIMLELTAVDPSGIDFKARDFTVDGLGSVDARLLWADPRQRVLAQGQTVTATLVYEIPNRAAALILAGDGARLDLGAGHHTK